MCCAAQEEVPEEQLVASMRGLLDTFMLRRLKEQVASQLVAKQQEVRAQGAQRTFKNPSQRI